MWITFFLIISFHVKRIVGRTDQCRSRSRSLSLSLSLALALALARFSSLLSSSLLFSSLLSSLALSSRSLLSSLNSFHLSPCPNPKIET